MKSLFSIIQSNFSRRSRGYTLLFAVLTAAFVLGAAVFILNISRKQFLLSTTARESIYAFYAAESGIECGALTLNTGGISSNSYPSIKCAGTTFGPMGTWGPVADPQTIQDLGFAANDCSGGSPWLCVTTPMYVSLPGNQCIQLTIYDGFGVDGNHKDVIDSRGYNICDATGHPSAVPNTLERGLRLIWEK